MPMPSQELQNLVEADEHRNAGHLKGAIEDGHVQLVQGMRDSGADFDKNTCNGQTPLAYLYQIHHRLDPGVVLNIRAAIEAKKIAREYSETTFSYSIHDHSIPPQTTTVAELSKENSDWRHSHIAKQLQDGENVEKLIWLHVGLTCNQLIVAVFRVFESKRWNGYKKDLMRFLATSLQISHSMPVSVDPYSNQRHSMYVSNSIGDLKTSFTVFPCLVLDTRAKMDEGRKKRQKAIQELNSLWGTSTQSRQSSAFQLDRTLDEAYYPGLSESRATKQNKDQIAAWEYGKNASKNDKETEDKRMPVLMVPQLWIWRAGRCVVTAYSMARPEHDSSSMYDQRFPLKMETNLPDLQIGLILAHHIEAFGKKMEPTGSHTFSSPLDVFESAVLFCMSDIDEYLDTPPSPADKKKELELIHSIADIQNELHMINEIIKEQEKVFKELLSDMTMEERYLSNHPEDLSSIQKQFRKPSLSSNLDAKRSVEKPKVESEPVPELPDWDTIQAQLTIAIAKKRLEEYQARIKKINHDAERMEKSIQDKLELKRTNASIKDAHNSLLISMAVVGFTVITVIFAPLAFLTALFALDVEGFDKLKVTLPPANDNEEPVKVFSSRKLAGIVVGSEVLTFAITAGAICLSIWALDKWAKRQDQIPWSRARKASRDSKPSTARPKKISHQEGKKKSDASLQV